MNGKKAVFFDIDGTIWDYKNYIPDSTREALRRLRKNGHSAFICSGRTRAYIQDPALFELGFDGIVSGCGTMIEHEGEVCLYKILENDLVTRTLKIIRDFGMRPIVEGKDYLYLEYDDFKDDMYGQKLMGEIKDRIRGIEECRGEWECSKLSCDTFGCNIPECREILKDEFDFIVHTNAVIEMVPKGFSKATGMKAVAERLGIGMEDTLAFGDGENDIEMITTAGKGIAMGNGNDHARSVADHVTDSLYEDGIYNALSLYGLI